jgi:rhodanese-related sulfurtransferase
MNSLQKITFCSAIAMVISIGSTMHVSVQAAGMEVKTIDVQQGKSMKAQGALLLDVREPEEYEQGHAPGSVLIPLGQLKTRLQEIRAFDAKPVVVICRSGRRSAQAADMLSQAGFTAVYNVQGGMNAWEAAALPIIKGSK